MVKIRSWIEGMRPPKLNEITGELKARDTRIDAVEKEIVSLRNEMLTKFEAVDTKFDKEDAIFNSREAKILAMAEITDFEAEPAPL